ncbi:integral membrane protein [Aspergillus sclerotialis]|uniref:Integral membrane protein n=1 Tax=Aspergillus sclerotialis TaxID=2070753 RepID=A0A3A2ZKV4_9EURO|nr:integral membrane protein [Aspergillus sclerotialis]
MTVENPYDALNTVNLVTQCLSIAIVTFFVALRFGIRSWYRQFVIVEDSMAPDPEKVDHIADCS